MRRTLFSTVSASRRNTPPSQSIPSPASPAPSLKTGGADNNEYTFKDFLDVKKIAKDYSCFLLTYSEGGFGEVFRAREEGGQVWAIKRVPLHGSSSGAAALREAETMTRLKNMENIVQIKRDPAWIEVDDESPSSSQTSLGALFIQMNFFSKSTLRDWLRSNQERNESQIRAFCGQIVTGLGHVHSKGLVHNDLTPNNILLSDEGTLLIADFGLSTEQPTLSLPSLPPTHGEDGSSVGLAASYYSSPELSKGGIESTTPLSDVYSFGVIIFEMNRAFTTEMQRYKELRCLRSDQHATALATLKGIWIRIVAGMLVEDPLQRTPLPAAALILATM